MEDNDFCIYQKTLSSAITTYHEIYYINIKKKYYRMIYPDFHDLNQSGNYPEAIDYRFKFDKIHNEDEQNIRNFLSIENIINKLSENDNIEYRYRRKNSENKYEWYLVKFVLIKKDENNLPIEVTMVITNIDETIKKENILKEALHQAEASNIAKTTFLTNISHDIRTPMNAIIGFTELANENISDTNYVADCLSKISKSSDYLLAIINNILDMSQIESSNININNEIFSIKKMCENISAIFLPQKKEKNINFFIDTSEVKHDEIISDKLRLSQIIVNLLGNSFKFTACNGTISMKISEIFKEDNNSIYTILVNDNGIGISEAFMPHLFEMFAREKNQIINKTEGSGLGLPIAKGIIKAMNGNISVSSHSGIGTSITVTLPVKFNPLNNYTKTNIEDDLSGFKNLRLLIAEDDELSSIIITSILKKAGFITETVSDGKRLFEIVKNSSPGYYAAVILDIQMPVMNGFEATENIRKIENKELSQIPIIAVTANVFEYDSKIAIKSGINAYISKPINRHELFAQLNKHIKNTSEVNCLDN